VGVCAVYKQFSGFDFFLLSNSIHARPQTANATVRQLGQGKRMNNRKIGKNQIITLLIMVIFSTSCSFSESTPVFPSVPSEFTDQSILTNNPCIAPCWNNLIPDESSTQDVLEVLTHTKHINPENIIIRNSVWWAEEKDGEPIPAILIRGLCAKPTDTVCVEILVVYDKVKEITITPNYRVSIEDVVKNWGNPDYVEAYPYGAECLGCILSLYWAEHSAKLTSVDRRCADGHVVCKKIYDGGRIPHGFVVDEIIYSGSVPFYVEEYSKDYRMSWAGFEIP
jgi:hypothetical protein